MDEAKLFKAGLLVSLISSAILVFLIANQVLVYLDNVVALRSLNVVVVEVSKPLVDEESYTVTVNVTISFQSSAFSPLKLKSMYIAIYYYLPSKKELVYFGNVFFYLDFTLDRSRNVTRTFVLSLFYNTKNRLEVVDYALSNSIWTWHLRIMVQFESSVFGLSDKMFLTYVTT